MLGRRFVLDIELDSVRDRAFAADARRGRKRAVPKLPRRLKKEIRKVFQASSVPVATYAGAAVSGPRNRRERQQAWRMSWLAARNDYEVYGPLVRAGVEQMLEIEDRRLLKEMAEMADTHSGPQLFGPGLVYATETNLRDLFAKSDLPEIKIVDNRLFG